MLIINLNNNFTLEKGLKLLKQKVIKTKQNEVLRERKEFQKKSVKLRNEKKNAIYRQRMTSGKL